MITIINENPTHKKIREHLEMLIKKNQHNPNYILPSENSLANTFKTSRTPVQKVLSELMNEGVIYKIRGKGTYIKQSTATNEKKTLYIIIPHMNTRYMQGIVHGIHDFFKDKNAIVMLMLTDDNPDIEKTDLEYIMTQKCDGIFFYPIITPVYHDVLLKLLLNQYNVITIGNYLPKLNFSSIHCDYYKQMYDLTRHLIEQGHKDIAVIFETVRDNYVYRDRLQGHFDCITQNTASTGIHLLEFDPHIIETENSVFCDKIREFLAKNPSLTAVIVASCFAEAMNIVLASDSKYDDLYVIVVDEPTDTEILRRKKTAILDQKPYNMGWQAAEQLYSQINEGRSPRDLIVEEYIVDSNNRKTVI